MKGLSDNWNLVKAAHASLPKAPVDVVALARKMGLGVYVASGFENNISGMIKKSDAEAGYSIYVNGNHPLNRRRFTIAHEIAHFMLHEDLIGDGIADDALYRSGLSNQVEAEANAMAADILMPINQVRPLWKDTKKGIAEMAAVFGVSLQAMGIRLGVPVDPV